MNVDKVKRLLTRLDKNMVPLMKHQSYNKHLAIEVTTFERLLKEIQEALDE